MSSRKLKLKILFKGDFSLNYLKKYTGIVLLNFIIWIGISISVYVNYDWISMDISYLGIYWYNPNGWVLFSIGMASSGILIIPIVSYIRNNINFENQKKVKRSCFFLYMACIGLIGLGAIPYLGGEVLLYIHYFNAGLAFIGLYLGVWILLLLMIRDENQKNRAIIPLIIIVVVIIGVILSQAIRISQGLPSKIPGNVFLSSSAWEWMLLVFIFIAIIILIYTSKPTHVKK